MGGYLRQLLSYSNSLVSIVYLKVLPQVFKLIILAICIIWKYFKFLKTSHKYVSMIDKKSSKFSYQRKTVKTDCSTGRCSICLLDYDERDELRRLEDCGHSFHRCCMDQWLKVAAATCPLCRSLVVPEAIVSEYRRVTTELANDGSEEELALILLKALPAGSCHGFPF